MPSRSGSQLVWISELVLASVWLHWFSSAEGHTSYSEHWRTFPVKSYKIFIRIVKLPTWFFFHWCFRWWSVLVQRPQRGKKIKNYFSILLP